MEDNMMAPWVINKTKNGWHAFNIIIGTVSLTSNGLEYSNKYALQHLKENHNELFSNI
jgi:hypothetical protein